MYRAYQPTLPTASLYLQEKWDRSRYEEHRRKVGMAVCAVDTKGPETPGHLLVNMKKIQMDKESQALVEKQNHIHYSKLKAIKQSQGRLDNWNCYPQHSLNAGWRRQRLSELTQENARLLERILKRESEYRRWESEWGKVEQIRANISRYPRIAASVWAGQQRVTFLGVRRSSDFQYLTEGSSTNSNQSRSTLRLESITRRTGTGTSKASLLCLEKRGRVSTSTQSKKSLKNSLGESASCALDEESACSMHSSETSNTRRNKGGQLEIQAYNKRRQKTSKSSEDNLRYLMDATNKNIGLFNDECGIRTCLPQEQEIRTCLSQEECEPRDTDQERALSQGKHEIGVDLSYRDVDRDSPFSNTERNTYLSHIESDQTIDYSPVESDVSSCYSLQRSEESPPSPTESTRMSETMSSLSINLKPRVISTDRTSQESKGSSEMSAKRAEGTSCPTSPWTDKSIDISRTETKTRLESSPQAKYRSSDPSIQRDNSSVDSLSQVMDQKSYHSSLGDNMRINTSLRAFSRGSSASSRTSKTSTDH